MYTKYTLIMMPILFITMGLLAFGVYFAVRNKSNKAKLIPFFVISIFFILLELSKQIYGLCTGYNLFWIPLHICSFFEFVPIFCVLLKKDKTITKVLWALSVTLSIMVTIGLAFAPEPIMGTGVKAVLTNTANYLNFHSVIHHAGIILFAFLSILLKPWKPDLKESLYANTIYGGFLIVAWIVSNILQVSYSSFLSYNTTFFGQLLLWIIYVVVFMLTAVVIYYTCKWYNKQTE